MDYVQMNVDINCINAYRWTGESVRLVFAYIDAYLCISHMKMILCRMAVCGMHE